MYLYGVFPRKAQIRLSAWDIMDIVYLSIVNSNDYREEINSNKELAIGINLYRKYENENSDNFFRNEKETANIFTFLVGMTHEQFSYQNLSWIMQRFNRNYHLLVGSNKINRDSIIDINKITDDLFGLDVNELLAVELIIMWLCEQSPIPLSVPEDVYKKGENSITNKDNIKKILDYYSVSYTEVRKSPLKRQVFYGKPFVVTQKKQELVSVNLYLVHMLMADGIYWLERDYYYKNGLGQNFINYFGKIFEEYFIELAEEYLLANMWGKIKEREQKSADFFIELDNAIMLLELKSGLLGIGAKQQISDIDLLEKFYDRNIRQAYEQLVASEREISKKKPIIKIILLYENILNSSIIMSSLADIFVNDSKCFLVTIEELEMFLVTYKHAQDKASEIVNDLLMNQNEIGKSHSFLSVLERYDVTNRMHFVDDRDYFTQIFNKLAKELQ